MDTLTLFRLLSRLPTSHWRALPDFMIIGAQKSGTTALYDYLSQHPALMPALQKETHFFDIHYARGLRFYRAYFPLRRQLAQAQRQQGNRAITGEATPYYLYHPHASQRIRAMLPAVKLIVLLRNPVDRAYSHYQHQVRRGSEPLSFGQAIDQETDRIALKRAEMESNANANPSQVRDYSYLARGLYAEQLEPWFRLFTREQFLIVQTEDLRRSPSTTFQQALRFLELPIWEPPDYPLIFQGSYTRLNPETRARLLAYFEPHNRRLYDMLGRDFGWDA